MKYLVTGGAGFIGSHLVEMLLQEGHEVIVYDNLSTGDTQNLVNLSVVGAVVKLAVADITDEDEFRKAIQGCDGIFHLAALPLVAQSVEEPVETHMANTYGTLIILNEARQAKIPVVFASSSSVYGDQGCNSEAQEEIDLPEPVSPYAATKLAGEAYCESFALTYQLPITVLRLFNVYGPRQPATSSYAGAIAAFCDAVAHERTPIIYGDGKQSRDFIYVRDVARAFVLAMHHMKPYYELYNVGTGQSYPILDVLRRLTDTPPEFQPARPGDVAKTQADVSGIRGAFGWQARYDLAYGLNTTLEWYLKNVQDHSS